MKKENLEAGKEAIELDNETLLKVFKGVSLLDLTGCEFEYSDDTDDYKWINAIYRTRVIDSIKWDGNIFWMMNNDNSFSPLNPMSSAFSIAGANWNQAKQATPVKRDEDFLAVLVENYQAQIAGFFNDDKTDEEKKKRQAVIDEYEDLIEIWKHKFPATPAIDKSNEAELK